MMLGTDRYFFFVHEIQYIPEVNSYRALGLTGYCKL